MTLLAEGPAPGEDGVPDIRGHYFAIGILVTALAALFTAPLTLLKAYINERQTTAAEQGLITDRFTKAVEQLGAEKTVKINRRYISYVDGATGEPSNWSHVQNWGEEFMLPEGAAEVDYGQWTVEEETLPNLEVRLGAIYALERIAQDSERDHIPIMETLCAYIRENAPVKGAAVNDQNPFPSLPPYEAMGNVELAAQALSYYEAGIKQRTEKLQAWVSKLNPPPADIQAAVTVLGRRPIERIEYESHSKNKLGFADVRFRLDLRNTNLQKADLTSARLDNVLLSNANLEGIILLQANLTNADFSKSRMEKSDLRGAIVRNAKFFGTHLEGAVFSESEISKSFFTKSNIQKTNFSNTHIDRSLFSSAQMEWSVFTNATIVNTTCDSTDFHYCHFVGVNLSRCDLSGSKFQFSELKDAQFQSLNLAGVDLSLAKILSQPQINESFGAISGNGATNLPDQLSPPDHWYDPDTDEATYFEKLNQWLADSTPPA